MTELPLRSAAPAHEDVPPFGLRDAAEDASNVGESVDGAIRAVQCRLLVVRESRHPGRLIRFFLAWHGEAALILKQYLVVSAIPNM